ncbi:MAG: ATP-binding protein [Akkermansiaceae bacterium]|nr:ATP-binding protein [Akkermansiaceae bacterium]
MNNSPTLANLLSSIQAMRAGMVAILTKEEELHRERAAKSLEARREHTRREEAETTRTAARLAELAAARRHALDRAEAALQARRAWLESAHQASRNALAEQVQEQRDHKIGSVQGGIFANRQARKKQLARATEEHKQFKAKLAVDLNASIQLRTEAYQALRSFRLILQPMFHGNRVQLADEAALMTPAELHAEATEHVEALRTQVAAIRHQPLTRFFRLLPLSLLLALVAAGHALLAWRSGVGWDGIRVSLMFAELAVIGLWLLGLGLAWLGSRDAAREMVTARTLIHAADETSAARLAKLAAAFEEEKQLQGHDLSTTFQESSSESQAALRKGQQELDRKFARLPAKLARLHQRKLAKLEQHHQQLHQTAQAELDAAAHQRKLNLAEITSGLEAAQATAVAATLAAPWQRQVLEPARQLAALEQQAPSVFPPFTPASCRDWEPPAEAPDAIRLGSLRLDLTELAGRAPADPQLPLPEPPAPTVPFALGFPDHGSLMLETDGETATDATVTLGTAALRILASLPPGRASFVFIDPVGLGRDFAGLMHLADYEETLITHRIWTQATQIEERLAELNEHIEKVIQMYLRNEYATIEEYNEQAGVIAEKYRFLVIAGFPAAFSETAAKRLLAIASSGARCGVHLLIHRDLRLPAPDPALEDQLNRTCMRVACKPEGFHLTDWPAGAQNVAFEPPPGDDDATTLVHRIGRASVDSNRVEVPFSQIAPGDDEIWSLDTTAELRVPVGRTGARKLQMLAIGKGTRQHMLVAGKTGSGKSTLFHVIITNLALWCRPDQVEFYLVDFKKGVEFKCYASKRLPHARVVAIESDREFALSVLQRVDAELKRRGELFRMAGSQDLSGYKGTPNAEPMPRSLLLIDEFQEFFTEDDSVAQEASLLLDRIVRQGRAFGIHVILGSQTLGGAYTLARATLGQMVIRVALQCNEADAHLIMDDDNPAPRLLTRPGEGIYNDQAGALAANSPFQIVWLPEAERDAMLDRVYQLAAATGDPVPAPIVFEGNVPAEVRDNPELAAALRTRPATRPSTSKVWLGAPNSIKGPTAAIFQRQSGSHLLLVSQSAERTHSVLGMALLSLAAQHPTNAAEFVLVDPHAPDSPSQAWFQQLAEIVPQRLRLINPAELPAVMAELAAQLESRAAGAADAPEVFLIIHDLQRIKALRPDDDFRFSLDDEPAAVSPAQALTSLLGEGGSAGMHVIAAIDTWNNVSRWIPRKTLGEFEMRILFQMSANDSANLIDSPAASTLGMHRALFHNEHYGTLETFRPYALPDATWLEETAEKLK